MFGLFCNAFPIFELCLLYPIAVWNLGKAATFFTKHRENGLKLTDFFILPSSSSEACIAEYFYTQ